MRNGTGTRQLEYVSDIKHYVKMRTCWLTATSPLPAMSKKVNIYWIVTF